MKFVNVQGLQHSIFKIHIHFSIVQQDILDFAIAFSTQIYITKSTIHSAYEQNMTISANTPCKCIEPQRKSSMQRPSNGMF